MTTPDDGTPLGVARDWLHIMREEGVTCPCCDQYAKVYRRKLPAVAAMVMIRMYRSNEGRGYVNVPGMFSTTLGERILAGGTGDGTKGQHWGLIEPQPGERDDGSTRNGWWQLTDPGVMFVRGRITVPKYAHIYNNQTLRLSGEQWTIRDALGTKFNFDELMRGV